MEQKYVMAAIDAALKAGEKILSIYNDPASDFEIERKADNSPLTIADRKAHEAIVAILNDTPFPVLSEEGKHLDYEVRRKWDTLWIVDPLDGTKEFIKRNGEFTVNIALVQNSVPVLGVIYVPVKRVLYFAVEGIGAYKCSGIVAPVGKGTTLQQMIKESELMPLEDVRDHFIVVASRSHLCPPNYMILVVFVAPINIAGRIWPLACYLCLLIAVPSFITSICKNRQSNSQTDNWNN